MSEAEYIDPQSEDVSSEIVQIQPTALAILSQSEHAAMVQTANLPINRRNLSKFQNQLMSYATHSQPVALSMFYTLPRAGKQIVGPSVRFAEIVAPCWKKFFSRDCHQDGLGFFVGQLPKNLKCLGNPFVI